MGRIKAGQEVSDLKSRNFLILYILSIHVNSSAPGVYLSRAKSRILTSVAYVEQHAARAFDQVFAARLDPQNAARTKRRAARCDQTEQLVGRDLRRLFQLEGESGRRAVNRDDAGLLRRAAQARVCEKSFDRFGRATVAILGLAPDLVQLLVVARRRHALV